MKTMKRIYALLLTVAMLIGTMSTTAFAAENPDTNDIPVRNSGVIPLEDTEYTREDAMRMLDLTEEEAEGASFFFVDAEPISDFEPGISPQTTIGAGTNYSFPTFTFSGRNVGSYWTCNGKQIKWTANHISSEPSDPNNYIMIFLYAYGDEDPNDVFACHSYMDFLMQGEKRSTGFMSATKGLDYHFVYYGGKQTKVHMLVSVK